MRRNWWLPVGSDAVPSHVAVWGPQMLAYSLVYRLSWNLTHTVCKTSHAAFPCNTPRVETNKVACRGTKVPTSTSFSHGGVCSRGAGCMQRFVSILRVPPSRMGVSVAGSGCMQRFVSILRVPPSRMGCLWPGGWLHAEEPRFLRVPPSPWDGWMANGQHQQSHATDCGTAYGMAHGKSHVGLWDGSR